MFLDLNRFMRKKNDLHEIAVSQETIYQDQPTEVQKDPGYF